MRRTVLGRAVVDLFNDVDLVDVRQLLTRAAVRNEVEQLRARARRFAQVRVSKVTMLPTARARALT